MVKDLEDEIDEVDDFDERDELNDQTRIDQNKIGRKISKSAYKVPIHDEEPSFRFSQFLGIIIIAGFLIIGGAAGTYYTLSDLMEAPCLGCLGLYPNVELNFTFETLNDKPHPDWVKDALKDGPIFIEFTQNDENCPPCARMRPYVEELNEKHNDLIVFFIININEHEVANTFKGETEITPSYTEENAYGVYDIGLIAGGRVATPTFIIITIYDDNGEIKPYFSTGYGEFVDEDAKKTAETLEESLDFALTLHHHYLEGYLKQTSN